MVKCFRMGTQGEAIASERHLSSVRRAPVVGMAFGGGLVTVVVIGVGMVFPFLAKEVLVALTGGMFTLVGAVLSRSEVDLAAAYEARTKYEARKAREAERRRCEEWRAQEIRKGRYVQAHLRDLCKSAIVNWNPSNHMHFQSALVRKGEKIEQLMSAWPIELKREARSILDRLQRIGGLDSLPARKVVCDDVRGGLDRFDAAVVEAFRDASEGGRDTRRRASVAPYS